MGFVDAAAWATASSITAARAQLLGVAAIEVQGVFLGPSSTMPAVEVCAGLLFGLCSSLYLLQHMHSKKTLKALICVPYLFFFQCPRFCHERRQRFIELQVSMHFLWIICPW